MQTTEKISVKFQRLYEKDQGWDVKENISPYISIADPDEDIEDQKYPGEIVIPMTQIKIEYTYPLSTKVVFDFTSDNENGFTRAELAKKICEGYQKIYDDEEAADKDPGPYGIWGHCIGDLDLRNVYQKNLGSNLFGLGVDS